MDHTGVDAPPLGVDILITASGAIRDNGLSEYDKSEGEIEGEIGGTISKVDRASTPGQRGEDYTDRELDH